MTAKDDEQHVMEPPATTIKETIIPDPYKDDVEQVDAHDLLLAVENRRGAICPDDCFASSN